MSTDELLSVAALTPRQLQWCDESGMISPQFSEPGFAKGKGGRRRLWSRSDAIKVLVMSQLKAKGMGHRTRAVIKWLPFDIHWNPSNLLITDGETHVFTNRSNALKAILQYNGPVILIELDEKVLDKIYKHS
jgi:hypothetical protein